MKLSTRGRYGLRAMVEIAKNFDVGPVLINSIAENQGISLKYLHSLLVPLKAKGLIRIIRGTAGGVVLTRDPAKIKVSEVIEALEGNIFIVDCVNDILICNRSKFCSTRLLWQEVSNKIWEIFENYTVKNLADAEIENIKNLK
jgi:Rrf2 family protein